MKHRLPIALTVAGSDSGGGAGVQADLKTFAALGVYGASVVTALTAQNTRGVRTVHHPPAEIVAAQIDAVLEDFDVAAIKIGMLGSAEVAGVVAGSLSHSARGGPLGKDVGFDPAPHATDHRLARDAYDAGCSTAGYLFARPQATRAFIVYDPVMTASSGDALSDLGFVETISLSFLPYVDCLTPNLAEAAALLGEELAHNEADMARQGHALLRLGPRAVLMKGGHLADDEAIDLLIFANRTVRFAAPKIGSPNLHGTGCTLSSAIAANIILGASLEEAVAAAKVFVRQSIERGACILLGDGPGPLIQAPLSAEL